MTDGKVSFFPGRRHPTSGTTHPPPAGTAEGDGARDGNEASGEPEGSQAAPSPVRVRLTVRSPMGKVRPEGGVPLVGTLAPRLRREPEPKVEPPEPSLILGLTPS